MPRRAHRHVIPFVGRARWLQIPAASHGCEIFRFPRSRPSSGACVRACVLACVCVYVLLLSLSLDFSPSHTLPHSLMAGPSKGLVTASRSKAGTPTPTLSPVIHSLCTLLLHSVAHRREHTPASFPACWCWSSRTRSW